MVIYTDGACHGNPGPGGFAVVVLDEEENYIERYSEHDDNTTNNRMELKAILYAFQKYGVLARAPEEGPIIYSDSSYAVNTLTSWMFGWARRGWLKSDNKTPENLDLIKDYYDHWQKGYRVNLKKVPGHVGVKYNEVADKLARRASDNKK